jgi:predicted MPP superfamily phosphohydrolase
LALVLELYNYIVQYSNITSGNGLISATLTPAQIFFLPFAVSVIFNTYGYIEAQLLSVERLTLKTSKLPEGIDRIRIAQISDLHLGIINRDNVLNRVVRKIEKEDPDMIVSTGDLVEGVVFHISYLADKLKKVNARLGKFAVLGNHEFYGGIRHSIGFIENSGFTILRGEGIVVENMINIAGIDDLAEEKKQRDNISETRDERDALSGLSPDMFTILLKHRSDVNSKSTDLFDLQLSGHTHKGQIFPINLITPFIFRHHSGFIRLPNRSALYVSRGAGTAGPPVRFLSRPEITVIDIVAE